MSDHDPAAPLPEIPGVAGGPATIEHAPEPAPVRVVRRGGTPLPLTLLLAAGLGGGLYYVWTNPKPAVPPAAADPGPAIAQARSQIESQLQPLSDQLQSLTSRVQTLEKRPAQPAPAPDSQPAADQINALAGRVEALEKRPAEPAAPGGDSGADLAKQVADLSSKTDALAAKQDGLAAEIAKQAELAAQRPAQTVPPPDMTAAQAPALQAQQQVADLGHRVDDQAARQTASDQALAQQKSAEAALEQRLDKLESNAQAASQAAQQDAASQAKTSAGQLAALAARVGKLEQSEGAIKGVAQDASRAARLEAAEAALGAGRPLGALPGAGPALARYATQAPPTDADLRARFPAVADAARAASQPDMAHRSLVDRMLARVQQSVTVRRGDHVIVGDPASGVLARAQDAVDRDDLKAAADALDGLTGPAADVARPWVAQVRGLLEARAALAAMARG